MTERKHGPKPESKGKLLGSWLTREAMDALRYSQGEESYNFSNDSESYDTKTPFQTKDRFSEAEIRQAALILNEHGVMRFAKSKVNSFISKYSWGGYQWSPSGPVNNWNNGESKGFEVDRTRVYLENKDS